MEDKKIICKDCGKEFIFSIKEQQFFAEKGFTNDPVRCVDCRRKRREARSQEENNLQEGK